MRRLNPFIKTLLILSYSFLLPFVNCLVLNGVIIFFCGLAICSSGAKAKTICHFILLSLLASTSLFFSSLFFPATVSIPTNQTNFQILSQFPLTLANAINLASRTLSYASLGISFALTTDGRELVDSFSYYLKLKPVYAYGILAACNMAHTISHTYHAAVLAYRARNINTFVSLKPLFTMLVNAINFSDHLSMAMESKGFDPDEERVHANIPRITFLDIFVSVLACLVLALSWAFRIKGWWI